MRLPTMGLASVGRLSFRIAGRWFLLLLFVFTPRVTFAEDFRKTESVSSSKVFEQMLLWAEDEDYEKVKKGMSLLEPVFVRVDQILTINMRETLENALVSKENQSTVETLQCLICLSIESLLKEVESPSTDLVETKRKIKQAFAEYIVLDSYVKRINFEESKSLQKYFRLMNATAENRMEQFYTSCQEIGMTLGRLFSHCKELAIL